MTLNHSSLLSSVYCGYTDKDSGALVCSGDKRSPASYVTVPANRGLWSTL